MDHGALAQLAAGAAIDDLEADEREELDRHLPSCSSCQELTADLDDVVEELALAAPTVSPPSSLRRDILAALHAADGPAPMERAIAVPSPGRPTRLATWGSLGLAAALGVVAVGFGAQTMRLNEELVASNAAASAAAADGDEARTKVAVREAAAALLGDPRHLAANLHAEAGAPGATAFVVYAPGSTNAYVMAMNLPPTPPGHVYQLWVADEAGVHPLGTFQFDGEGAFVAPFGVDLGASAAAMVTLEPVGGAQGEPGPQVVFGEF